VSRFAGSTLAGVRALAVIVLAGCGRFDFRSEARDAAAPAAPLVWTAEASGTTEHLWDIAGFGTDVFVAGDHGDVLHSSDGVTWTPEPLANGTEDYGIGGLSPSDIYAVGNVVVPSAGIMVFHRDGTGAWTLQGNPFTRVLNSVIEFAPNDVYVCGYGGTLAHFDGSAWTQAAGIDPNASLLRLWASSPGDLYVVGYDATDGVILHSTGDGTWSAEASGTASDLVGIWGASATDIYVAGHDGTILHSTGDGAWTAQDTGTTQHLYAVWGSSGHDLYAAGPGSVILHSTGDGTWTQDDTGAAVGQFEEFWGSGPDSVFVVGDNGTILHGTR
jgi:hypothetical protein